MARTDKHFLFFSENISGNTILLDRNETAHLSGVLRFGEDDEIQVTDGNGRIFECKIIKMKKDSTLCEVLSKRDVASLAVEITLAVGMPDKDKFEQICETANPLGVKKIVPLITERCDKKLFDGRFEKIKERCRRKIISSSKQSLNPYLTSIEEPVKLSDFINKTIDGSTAAGGSTANLLADFDGKPIFEIIDKNKIPKSICVFVGPPAGFSDDEIENLSKFCQKIYLGKYRLRTELAAISAVSTIGQYI